MRYSLRRLSFCLAALLWSPSAVGAEDPTAVASIEASENMSARAVRLGHEGLKHYSEGRFSEALEAFTEADSIAHSPVFVLYRARSSRKMNALLRARSLYRMCAREEVSGSTPPTWEKAIADAVVELDQLEGEIPRVRISARGGAKLPVTLTFAGRTVLLKEPELTLEFDPGVVEFEARDARGTRVATQLFVAQGERFGQLTLNFPRTKRLPEQPQTSTPMVWEDHRAPRRPYRSGAHAAFLVGGASFILGTVSAVVAVRQAREVKRGCVGTSCRPEDKELARSATNWANTATAAYAAGAVGVATGVGLLFWPTGVGVSGKF